MARCIQANAQSLRIDQVTLEVELTLIKQDSFVLLKKDQISLPSKSESGCGLRDKFEV